MNRPTIPYTEHHLQKNLEDIGVAWTENRVWVCVNGQALLRIKFADGRTLVEFTPPESYEHD